MTVVNRQRHLAQEVNYETENKLPKLSGIFVTETGTRWKNRQVSRMQSGVHCGVRPDPIVGTIHRSAAEAAESDAAPSSQQNFGRPASLPTMIARFEIREKLGEGGFGSVYRAYDPVLDRETALKVPHRSSNLQRQFDRILKEAKAAARLRHPNIVAVFEVGSLQNQPFIAAEFVKGRAALNRVEGIRRRQNRRVASAD